jgi:hypothetical protein
VVAVFVTVRGIVGITRMAALLMRTLLGTLLGGIDGNSHIDITCGESRPLNLLYDEFEIKPERREFFNQPLPRQTHVE